MLGSVKNLTGNRGDMQLDRPWEVRRAREREASDHIANTHQNRKNEGAEVTARPQRLAASDLRKLDQIRGR